MVQVMTPSGKDPVDQLISQELARPYCGGHIFGWCKDQTTGLTKECKQYDDATSSK
jgi:hypothetical protein